MFEFNFFLIVFQIPIEKCLLFSFIFFLVWNICPQFNELCTIPSGVQILATCGQYSTNTPIVHEHELSSVSRSNARRSLQRIKNARLLALLDYLSTCVTLSDSPPLCASIELADFKARLCGCFEYTCNSLDFIIQ